MLKTARPYLVLLPLVMLAACENMQKAPSNYDPYVSNYGNDGGYNPYPGQPGYAQSGGAPAAPSYDLPPAPVEADPYAFSTSGSTTPKPSGASASTPKKPATTASKSSTSSKSKAAPKKAVTSGTHTVVKGDTLYGIALKRKTTVAKIKAANGLKSGLIRPGQKLKIP